MCNYSAGLQPHSVILKIFFSFSSDDLNVSVVWFVGTQVLFIFVAPFDGLSSKQFLHKKLSAIVLFAIINDTYPSIKQSSGKPSVGGSVGGSVGSQYPLH